MKILLSILEILIILGMITNYKLLKKKSRKKEEWLISHLFIKLIDIKDTCLYNKRKKEVSGSFFFDIQSIDVMNIILMKV